MPNSPVAESEAGYQSHTERPVYPSRHFAKPGGRYGFAAPADDGGISPDEDGDGDEDNDGGRDGADDDDDDDDENLRPDGDNIDEDTRPEGEEHDIDETRMYDQGKKEYDGEGGWDDWGDEMNGPGDANNSEKGHEPSGFSRMDIDQCQ